MKPLTGVFQWQFDETKKDSQYNYGEQKGCHEIKGKVERDNLLKKIFIDVFRLTIFEAGWAQRCILNIR